MRPVLPATLWPAGPDGGEKVVHIGILGDDGRHRLLLPHHGVEGDALGRFGEGEDRTRVLAGEEALGNNPEQDRG